MHTFCFKYTLLYFKQVVQQLEAYGVQFRVLALSATPGSNLLAAQEVRVNL